MNQELLFALRWFLLSLIALLALFFFFMPALTRRDIFFSVTVLPVFRQEASGRMILRRYRLFLAVHTFIAAGFVIAGTSFDIEWLPIVGVFWLLGGIMHAFLDARSRAHPFAAPPSAVREAVLAPHHDSIAPQLLASLGALLILLWTAATLHLHWEEIPSRFPIHWGADGRPNGWATRSFFGVYGPLFLAGSICLMMELFIYGILRWTRRVRASGSGARSESRFRGVQSWLLVGVQYFLAATFSWTSLLALSHSNNLPQGEFFLMLGLGLAFAFATVIVSTWTGQGGARLDRPSANVASPRTGTHSPSAEAAVADAAPIGDRTPDNRWVAGQFYWNPDDPAIFVEKRFGIGYTMNFAHPVAWLLIAALLLIPVVFAVFMSRAK